LIIKIADKDNKMINKLKENKRVTKADLWQASQARLSMSGLTIQKYSFVLQQESKKYAILNKIAFTLSATGNTQSS